MKKLFQKLIKSFDNTKEGFSGRKLSAFVSIMTAIYVTAKKVPAEYQIEALYAWLGFALLCLGIVTIQNILEFKNGNRSESKTTLETTITNTETNAEAK